MAASKKTRSRSPKPVEQEVDAIAGSGPEPMETEILPGESDPIAPEAPAKEAETVPVKDAKLHPHMELLTLARDIFASANTIRNNRPALTSLTHFQQITILGAYALTGQILRKTDQGGRVTLGRYAGSAAQQLFSAQMLGGFPPLPDDFEYDRTIVNRPLERTDVKNADENALIELESLGLSDKTTKEIMSSPVPDVRAYLSMVFEEVRAVRASQDWMKLFFDFHRKFFQGVQIAAAQLLGLTDARGAVTLKRYLGVGSTDPRVFNALGFWKPKRRMM
jgi:hypothetical protein